MEFSTQSFLQPDIHSRDEYSRENNLIFSLDIVKKQTIIINELTEIQTSEVVIIGQSLEPLLDIPLESLIANEEIKQHILDCFFKLGQLVDHIPISM